MGTASGVRSRPDDFDIGLVGCAEPLGFSNYTSGSLVEQKRRSGATALPDLRPTAVLPELISPLCRLRYAEAQNLVDWIIGSRITKKITQPFPQWACPVPRWETNVLIIVENS